MYHHQQVVGYGFERRSKWRGLIGGTRYLA
jgi:hypothetical protein